MANVSLEELSLALRMLNTKLEAIQTAGPIRVPIVAEDPKAEQLRLLEAELELRPSLTVAEAARLLGQGIKTASRRLKELARLGKAHVYFEPHGYTVHLRAIHPNRVVLDTPPGAES